MPSPGPLHVTNGDSTAGTLRQTSLGGEVVAWRDALHEGPVPAGTDDDVWLGGTRVRGRDPWRWDRAARRVRVPD